MCCTAVRRQLHGLGQSHRPHTDHIEADPGGRCLSLTRRGCAVLLTGEELCRTTGPPYPASQPASQPHLPCVSGARSVCLGTAAAPISKEQMSSETAPLLAHPARNSLQDQQMFVCQGPWNLLTILAGADPSQRLPSCGHGVALHTHNDARPTFADLLSAQACHARCKRLVDHRGSPPKTRATALRRPLRPARFSSSPLRLRSPISLCLSSSHRRLGRRRRSCMSCCGFRRACALLPAPLPSLLVSVSFL